MEVFLADLREQYGTFDDYFASLGLADGGGDAHDHAREVALSRSAHRRGTPARRDEELAVEVFAVGSRNIAL